MAGEAAVAAAEVVEGRARAAARAAAAGWVETARTAEVAAEAEEGVAEEMGVAALADRAMEAAEVEVEPAAATGG